ncbi:flavodoxin family protein [Candidatus Sumerlaeota bacterium]|nr:flavodoxin family protein [Candidatus Sumerlaeota bacterium]
MRVLGISGSPRRGQTTERLVQRVLGAIKGHETEFVSLAGLNIKPCGACLGCTGDNTCVLTDDMEALRPLLERADAYVIGAPNYFSMLNAQMHALMERWFQFRHRGGEAVRGKLGVAIGVGGSDPNAPAVNIETFFRYNGIECIGRVTAMGANPCYVCGHGITCRDGAVFARLAPGQTEITDEMVPDLSKQPEVIARALRIGQLLSQRLSGASPPAT